MDKIIEIRQNTRIELMSGRGELCTCDCGKPKFPKTSKYHILSINSSQTINTKIIEKRHSIIDVLKKYNRPLKIMEIGVMAGDFAYTLYKNLNIDKMVLIDPFNLNDSMSMDGNPRFTPETHFSYVCNRFIDNHNVEVIQGLSGDVLPKMFLTADEKNKFDFIYIDSNHEFYNTYNEILYASQLVKQNGIIGIDDYTLSLDDPVVVHEVMQAVTKFLDNNREWKVIYYSFNDAGIPNIYLSKMFETEHPRLDSNQRQTD